jgi:hypothetical protein
VLKYNWHVTTDITTDMSQLILQLTCHNWYYNWHVTPDITTDMSQLILQLTCHNWYFQNKTHTNAGRIHINIYEHNGRYKSKVYLFFQNCNYNYEIHMSWYSLTSISTISTACWQ